MNTILFLLVALAILYLILRLFERGAVKAWQAWRERGRGRAEQVIVFRPDPDDQPRRPRPNLKREQRTEQPPPTPQSSPADEP